MSKTFDPADVINDVSKGLLQTSQMIDKLTDAILELQTRVEAIEKFLVMQK